MQKANAPLRLDHVLPSCGARPGLLLSKLLSLASHSWIDLTVPFFVQQRCWRRPQLKLIACWEPDNAERRPQLAIEVVPCPAAEESDWKPGSKALDFCKGYGACTACFLEQNVPADWRIRGSCAT